MDFAFSEEQEMLRTAARDYLGDRYPIERVVALADGDQGWDPDSWKQLAALGWLDPELGFLEHAVLFEETGRALLPGPLLPSLAALPLLDGEMRAALAAGERSFTFAHVDGVAPTAVDADGRLTGRKLYVPDATLVTDALVVAGGQVHAVDLAAHPEVVVARSTMDRTRRLGELALERTPARLVAAAPDLAAVRRRTLAALACEAVGVGQWALDVAAEHAKNRQAFGRPIGSYQGVSHKIADMYAAVQLARSLAYWAAWAVDTDDPQAAVACAAAKSAAGEAAVHACESAIQALGGIGFTWEHPLHRYYKRAQWIDSFEGFGAAQRAEIAAVLLGGPASAAVGA